MTAIRHQVRILVCVASLAFLAVGCSKDEEADTVVAPQKTTFEITVAYPVNGLGDRSYSDLLNLIMSLVSEYIPRSYEQASLSYRIISPVSTDDMKEKLQVWDDTPKLDANTYHLLILADETYEDLMAEMKKWHEDSRRDVVVLNRHNEKATRTYYLDIPLYGPAWESGYMAGVEGDKPALMMANNVSPVMTDARQGWLDGYAAGGGNPAAVPVVDDMGYDEKRATEVSDSLFQAGYDNVVCVIGGGQTGALRSLVFHRSLYGGIYNDKYLTLCENDFGTSYAPYIRYSIFKDMETALLSFVKDWIDWRMNARSTPPDRVKVYDLLDESVGQRVMGLLAPTGYYTAEVLCDGEIREMAAEAEKRYYTAPSP